jgi:hypothetical protein
VTVELANPEAQTVLTLTARANSERKWLASLPPTPASGPYTITVSTVSSGATAQRTSHAAHTPHTHRTHTAHTAQQKQQ